MSHDRAETDSVDGGDLCSGIARPGGGATKAEVQSILRSAEAESRRQVNEYRDRLRQLDFSRRPNAAARKGMDDTIVNNHRSHLQQPLNTVYTTEVRTLAEHEQAALRKLHEAERR